MKNNIEYGWIPWNRYVLLLEVDGKKNSVPGKVQAGGKPASNSGTISGTQGVFTDHCRYKEERGCSI